MIKFARPPIFFGMAAVTFIPISSFMPLVHVILAMAGHTGRLQFEIRLRAGYAALVAGIAFCFLVLIVQREMGAVVIKTRGSPAPFVMTIGTLLAQLTLVAFFLIVFFMTGDTFFRQFVLIDLP